MCKRCAFLFGCIGEFRESDSSVRRKIININPGRHCSIVSCRLFPKKNRNRKIRKRKF